MRKFIEQFEAYKNLINERLKAIIDLTVPNSKVAQAMHYSLNIGGKRIRPILVLEFCRLCGGLIEDVLDVACAIEMIHTYSLIHDDLPCMDNDDLRRGKPACHIKFNQAIAVLAGDGLLTEAFNVIANANIDLNIKIDIIRQISDAVGYKGMIAGQSMDMDFEDKADKINSEILCEINNLKTGKLIQAAAITGCLAANGTSEQINSAKMYANNIGLAFQIRDDIIDVIGDESVIGKPVKSDIQNKKCTYVSLYGVQKCEEEIKNLYTNAIKVVKVGFNKDIDFINKLTFFLLNRNS